MSEIRDSCRRCELRGDMAKCAATECYNHDNWYATALRAENERLRRWRCEADCRYTMGDVAETSGSHCPTDRPCARCEAEMEHERLLALLREVAQCGVESADERVRYVTVQIDRDTWAAVQEEARRV